MAYLAKLDFVACERSGCLRRATKQLMTDDHNFVKNLCTYCAPDALREYHEELSMQDGVDYWQKTPHDFVQGARLPVGGGNYEWFCKKCNCDANEVMHK